MGASLVEQSIMRAAQARSQALAAGSLPKLFDIEKVADGVYAAVARPAALINCNAAIFENDKDMLIVDTHSKPSAVVGLVSQIRDLTRKPVRYIVNSHFHWDHTQGNPTYRDITPNADFVASDATRRLLAENGAARLKASVDEARANLETHKQKRAAAKTAEERTYWDGMMTQTDGYIREMRGYAPELQAITFERDLILRYKAHDLHLAFRGRGHTGGDVVVFCPQKRVAASGDLLHGFPPFLADGYPREWPSTLLAFATEFDFRHVIGGHGAVQHTRDRLYQMGTYIEEIAMLVTRGKPDGKSVAQLQGEIRPDNLKSLANGGYGEFFGSQRLKFTPNPPGTTVADIVGEAVKTNIAHTWGRL